ncbi:hypothetical protein OEK97_28245, partial [Escherichia coli]|uniref:hypothetical protein n=1 Tax=Escherichia coli TaxID=562 RepID=UPI0021D96BDE
FIDIAAHAAWLYGIWPGASALAPSFWSLQVEWEFYLFAPLLLLIAQPSVRWAFVGGLFIVCLLFRYLSHNTIDGLAQFGTCHLPM